jgi:hypothetical protein
MSGILYEQICGEMYNEISCSRPFLRLAYTGAGFETKLLAGHVVDSCWARAGQLL